MKKRFSKKTALAVLCCVCVCALLIWAIQYWRTDPWAFFWPGGFRPSYSPTAHDRRLTMIARAVLPMISANEAYQRSHGRYPAESTYRTVVISGHNVPVTYYLKEPNGYRLYVKLGWDSSLIYEANERGGSWWFGGRGGAHPDPLQVDLAP